MQSWLPGYQYLGHPSSKLPKLHQLPLMLYCIYIVSFLVTNLDYH